MISEEELEKILLEVDCTLREKKISIPSRPIHAIGIIAQRLGIPLPIVPSPHFPNPEGDKICRFIHDWFEKRYGDRLKIDFGPGSLVVILQGDLWEIKLPGLWGKFKVICWRAGDPIPTEPSYSVLTSIKGLTKELAASLTQEECQDVCRIFLLGFSALQGLSDMSERPFIREARADFATAVRMLLHPGGQFGQSAWATLQGTEKVLKSLIQGRGGKVVKSHDLRELAKSTISPLHPDLVSDLDLVQCDAGARYGQVSVSQDKAVAAHHASLRVVSHLLPQFTRVRN